MKLVRQVLHDLRRELLRILCYAVLLYFILVQMVYSIGGYRLALQYDADLLRFSGENAVCFRYEAAEFNVERQSAAMPYYGEELTMEAYLTELFSPEGKGGSYHVMYYTPLPYRMVVVIMGTCAEETPFALPEPNAPVTFAVSPDLAGTTEQGIVLNGISYPLYVAPEKMRVPHPWSIGNEFTECENTLFVFSKDYMAVKQCFPYTNAWQGFYEMSDREFFNRVILRNPTEQDILCHRRICYENLHCYVIPERAIDIYESGEGLMNVRTYLTTMIFFCTAGASLLGVMLYQIYTLLLRKSRDYATHLLFGATEQFIFARMFLFALAYHALPMLALAWQLSAKYAFDSAGKFITYHEWKNAAPIMAVTPILVFAVTALAFRVFLRRYHQGNRGD